MATGFRGVVQKHPEWHGRTDYTTTSHAFFGQQRPLTAHEFTAQARAANTAGGNKRAFEDQRIKLLSNLHGEIYHAESDPQQNTDVQRCWLYAPDPAIRAVKARPQGANGPPTDLKASMLPYDNALSLPLGEGQWAIHPRSSEVGFYRRKGTDVTRVKNVVITRK